MAATRLEASWVRNRGTAQPKSHPGVTLDVCEKCGVFHVPDDQHTCDVPDDVKVLTDDVAPQGEFPK